MEAQTISFPLGFLSPSNPYFSLYLSGHVFHLSLVPFLHLHVFCLSPPCPSLPYSPVVVSFWLTSSLASFLPFSVSSLEKLCALRGEHPFYTRANASTRIRVSTRLLHRFFSFPLMFRIRTLVRVCVFLHLHVSKMLLTTTSNWRLRAWMGVPRGRVKLIAAGTVSLIDCRRLAQKYVYGRLPRRVRPASTRQSEKVLRAAKKRARITFVTPNAIRRRKSLCNRSLTTCARSEGFIRLNPENKAIYLPLGWACELKKKREREKAEECIFVCKINARLLFANITLQILVHLYN